MAQCAKGCVSQAPSRPFTVNFSRNPPMCLKYSLLRKSYALLSRDLGVPTEVGGRRRMPGAFYRGDWSLVISQEVS